MASQEKTEMSQKKKQENLFGKRRHIQKLYYTFIFYGVLQYVSKLLQKTRKCAGKLAEQLLHLELFCAVCVNLYSL